jgi:hypothetical protein
MGITGSLDFQIFEKVSENECFYKSGKNRLADVASQALDYFLLAMTALELCSIWKPLDSSLTMRTILEKIKILDCRLRALFPDDAFDM